MNLERCEAVIRTDLNGASKIYTLEKEVKATEISERELILHPVKKRSRFKKLCEEKDSEVIELFEAFGEEPVHLDYARMWRTLSDLYGAIREHQITRKPLKIKRPKKVA